MQNIKGWHTKRLSQLAQAVKYLTSLWEVPRQDFTCATDYFDRGFFTPHMQMSKKHIN